MMKKIIIIVCICLFLLAVLVTGGIIYLNNVFLPKTIRSLIVKSIEERTNSRVNLGDLRVNIFKGLVLSNLEIYRQESAIVKIKEASCLILPFRLFRKQIIIPIVNIKSAQIFLERRKDNTFNLGDMFSSSAASAVSAPGTASSAKPGAEGSAKKGFQFSVYRVNISNARVTFRDSTLNPVFIKSVENINLAFYLALPASVKFKLSALIPSVQPMNISASGEYKAASRELSSKLSVSNFSPGDFSPYYGTSGLKISGLFNATSDIDVKGNFLLADNQLKSRNLNIQQKGIGFSADTNSRVILEYVLSDKKLKISGTSVISNGLISGLKFVDTVNSLNCSLNFNNLGLSTDNLTAGIFGIPVKGRLALSNFSDPVVNANASASLNLASAQVLLKDKFRFNFPGTINGQGNLSLALEGGLKEKGGPALNAWLDMVDTDVKFTGLALAIKGLSGRIAFARIGQALPLVNISLKSDTLSLASILNLQDKLIRVTKCAGRYFSSEFSITGDISTADPGMTGVALGGELRVDLQDLKHALPGSQEQLDKIKPEGKVKAQFNLSGNINDPKGYLVNVELSSPEISLYGLKGTDLLVSYNQANGLANIESCRLSLYNGSLEAAFTANLGSKDIPYWFTAALQGVEIKELKKDTLAKNKDISGLLEGGVKANGFLSRLADTQGAGRLAITKGKLWELDLFKGLGKIMFSQEFSNIVFYEGTCSFIIKDKAIFTEDLALKSSMINLFGPVRIGFDGSLNARLDVDIISELVPLTGTFKDIATALVSQSGKFAEIIISGTLKAPKYSFQTAVTDIIKGLADTFLKKI